MEDITNMISYLHEQPVKDSKDLSEIKVKPFNIKNPVIIASKPKRLVIYLVWLL